MTNDTLFRKLLQNGIRKEDAEVLSETFNGLPYNLKPDQYADQFVEGMNSIAEALALKDTKTFFDAGGEPKSDPWVSIYEVMSQMVVQDNEDPLMAFSQAMAAYENDRTLQGAFTNAIGSRMTVIQKNEQSKGQRKNLKTKDYKKALKGLGYSFRMRELDNRLEVNQKPIEDHIEDTIVNAMVDRGFGVDHTKRTISELAGKNKYHPIKQYLDGLTWDGGSYIEKLGSYFNDAYGMFPTWLRKWLIGAVAKVYEAAQNPMLILDGKQGIGKSVFAMWLAGSIPEYFIEGAINTNDKDCQIRLINSWIWEVSELGTTTRKSDYEALKAFLTTRKVTVRKPYGKRDIERPALASFIGTINNSSGIFSDPTGSRRFLTSKLTDIVWDYSKDLSPNDVWAEAMAAYRDGEDWKLTPDEYKKSNEINTQYDVPDPVEGLIKKFFELDPSRDDWWIPTSDIVAVLKDPVKGGLRGNDKTIQMDLGKTMTRLGHESKRRYNSNSQSVAGYTGIKLNSVSPFTNP
jgi:predicted P-loop ATPase